MIPFTPSETSYNFSVNFFTGFLVIAFLWTWISFAIFIFMPLWESKNDKGYIMGVMEREMTRKIFIIRNDDLKNSPFRPQTRKSDIKAIGLTSSQRCFQNHKTTL